MKEHNIIRRTVLFLSMALLLMCMAVSCPDPVSSHESEAAESSVLKSFKASSLPGLYIKGNSVVTYDSETYQRAWSTDGKLFRIQKDDQSAFFNSEREKKGPLSEFSITYMTPGSSVSSLTFDCNMVKYNDTLQWWWNEALSTGIIVPTE